MKASSPYFSLYRVLKRIAYAKCGCERCLFTTMFFNEDFGEKVNAFQARAWFEVHSTGIQPCPNGLAVEFSTLGSFLCGHGKTIADTTCGRCGSREKRDRTLTVSAVECRENVVEFTLTCDQCGVGKSAFIDTRVVDELADYWGGAVRDEVATFVLRTAWPRKENT